MNWIRRIAPWVLLAVYLPLVVVSSLHVHHDTVDIHDDCLQCVGHFETQHNHNCDCQYCHFLSLSYLGKTVGWVAVFVPSSEVLPVSECNPTLRLSHGVSLLRAPPVVSLRCSNA